MSIIIQPYREEHQNALIAFNQRLRTFVETCSAVTTPTRAIV